MTTRSLIQFLIATASIAAPVAFGQHMVYRLGAEATNNDDFGRSVADAGDVDGDGLADVIVGAPFDGVNGAQSGSVFIYSGRTGDLVWTRAGDFAGDAFGWSVDGIGDISGDGRSEVIVGAPLWDNNGAWNANGGKIYVLSPATNGMILAAQFNETNAQLGSVVRGLGDISGDGVPDFAYCIPYRDWNGVTDSGYVAFYSGAGPTFMFSRSGSDVGALFGYALDVVRTAGSQATNRMIVGEPGVNLGGLDRGRARLLDGFGNTVNLINGTTDNEWTGAAVAGIGDTNNDGWEDYAVSAPYNDTYGIDAGYVRVYSGATGTSIFSVPGATAGANMGQSLARLGDFNGDGRVDFLAGAPNDHAVNTGGGEARVISGQNGSTLASWTGGTNDHLGRSVSSAGDINQDGVADIIVGANDAPFGAGEAYVHLSRLGEPTIYCTPKVNSQGCLPQISAQGTPSLSIADDCSVSAASVINQKSGILFWGYAPHSTAFLGGTLCVQSPVTRTPIQSSGGNTGPDDCSGVYTFHFSHVYMAAKGILAGQRVHSQFWSRDPASPFGVGLTDAVAFDVVP